MFILQKAQEENIKRKEKEEKERKAKEKAVRISLLDIIPFTIIMDVSIPLHVHGYIILFVTSQEIDRIKKEDAKNQKNRGQKNLLDQAGDDEGVLDGLMQALETGSAFRDPSRPARRRQPRKG